MVARSIRELAARSVASRDGTPIFYRAWSPARQSCKAAIIVIPGIGLHGLMYRVVAEALAPGGYLVILVDVRGHGKSGGLRGGVPTADMLRRDLDSVVADVRLRYRPDRLYGIGESMGGLIALNYVALAPRALDGVVFVSPALRVHPAQIFQSDTLRIAWSLLRSPTAAAIDVGGSRLDEASVDEDFKAAKRGDRLTMNRVTLGYLYGLQRLMMRWRAKARRVVIPTLVMHGKLDRVLDWRASRQLHRAIATPDKELILFPSGHHTLFWDPVSSEVFSRILGWIEAHETQAKPSPERRPS